MTPAIIPVIDLMIGQVVLAQNGDRGSYAPIHTKLTKVSEPVAVAKALFGQTACDCLYLADLDSLEGAKPNWFVLNKLTDVGFKLWVDADWLSDDEQFDKLQQAQSQSKTVRPIVSTERISDLGQLNKLTKFCEAGIAPIVSIDLRGGNLISKDQSINVTPNEIVMAAREAGVGSVIWLDVAQVGTNAGVESACSAIRTLKQNHPDIVFISGGGVRSPEDAKSLINAGCQHVLVASAIHDCKFIPDDVSELSDLRLKTESGSAS